MTPQLSDSPYIIAIDDEKLNIELMRFFLERQNFEYSGTSSLQSFYKMIKKRLPNLILMDVQMPKKNGLDLCQELKEISDYQDIPVIFITGKDKVEDKVEGFAVGGVDYITKPFNEHELVARVRTHCNLSLAKKEIEVQAEKLKKSNELKDRIFSIIGHDLRSPLSAAKLKMDFIRRGIIDPTTDEFKEKTVYELLKTMDESLNLLQNLLGWAKSESGSIQVISEVLDLNELVQQVFRLLKLGSEHKSISLTNNVQQETFVQADLNTIKTVLRNLVSNAIKFTPKNGEIKVNTVLQDNRLTVEVRDNGQGIAQEDITKIFNKTEHYSKLGTENEPGTGLGLVLCQDFVQKNGGTLKVNSVLGKGTTFYFDLALAEKVLA